MAKIKQDFEIYLGEDKKLTFDITDDVDQPLDLTDSQATWVLASTLGATDVVLTKTIAGGSISIVGTTYEVIIYATDTTTLPSGKYQHELRMVDSSGSISVLATGDAVLKPSLTNI